MQRKQVQELIGHCLYRKIITETSLILIGSGSNGKTIFLKVITRFFGPENVSGHSIQTLCYDKFALDEIKDKFVNICPDLPHKKIQNTGRYKGLFQVIQHLSM